jgi:hypothetical protein
MKAASLSCSRGDARTAIRGRVTADVTAFVLATDPFTLALTFVGAWSTSWAMYCLSVANTRFSAAITFDGLASLTRATAPIPPSGHQRSKGRRRRAKLTSNPTIADRTVASAKI